MAGYVIHIAITQEFLRKNSIQYNKDFIDGTIYPDLIKPKSKTHYGTSPAYTNLYNFLLENKIDSDFNIGWFIHLITDYLFYNHYLNEYSKEDVYNDYDILNKSLINKYNVKILDNIKDVISFKDGKTKLLDYDFVCKIIDEISSLNIQDVKKEVLENSKKWNYYKKLI